MWTRALAAFTLEGAAGAGANDEMSSEDGKPGFFSRMRRAISSSVDDAMDSMTDPGQELALLLDELAEEIKKAEGDLKQAVVDRKMMERKLEDLGKKERAWQGRAEQALKLGDDFELIRH